MKYYKFRYNQLFYIKENNLWKPLLFWPMPHKRSKIDPYFEHNTGSFLLQHERESGYYFCDYSYEIYDRINESEYRIFSFSLDRSLFWKYSAELDPSPNYIKRLSSGWHDIYEINNPTLVQNVLSAYKTKD